ncbi:pyrroline-5-carboxylate reductase [Sphingosinicella sp. CPCC 101087]|uniref:pyrroline-5-carboxylate reductase family protein n=1 Tax=Sphingosinicella sp. CPCC 101087 TaxID=2497754 RepID=UPI00101C3174|nr:pyrroline-5-carboxylate reductase [Sphingosinicella sp. CPCC 101087]
MADPLLPGPLWLIGCGNMGSAMLDGWIAAGVDPSHVSVVRPSGRAVGHGIRVLTECPEDEVPAIVLLAMKPRQLDAVAPELAPVLDPQTILVSILAGVEQESLRARFPTPGTIVRAMPNLPVRYEKGVVGLFSDSPDVAARAMVTGLMASLGHAEWFDDESLFQLGGALTGAGPAFLFRFIEALGTAAEQLGLPHDQAGRLATAMVEGAAIMAARSEEGPARLAQRVASPGGTTEAGLDVLDAGDSLNDLVARTLEASRRRSHEMAAEARRG